MVIRVFLRLSGTCQITEWTRSLQQAITRHPLLTCRLGSWQGKPAWIHGLPARMRVDSTDASINESLSGQHTVDIDLKYESGLQVRTEIRRDGIVVTVDAHHAVTDGNGLIQLITDWLHIYHCAVTGQPIRLKAIEPLRLLHRDQFPQPPAVAPISTKEAIRNFMVTVLGRTARWKHRSLKTPSAPNGNLCIEHIFSKEECDRILHCLAEHKSTLNDFVMSCCFAAFAATVPRVNNKHRITILNPTELRRPSDRNLPAVNRFGFAFMRRSPTQCKSPAELLKSLQGEITYVRSNYIGVEFIHGLAAVMKFRGGLTIFQRIGCFVPSMQWTCLGDVTRTVKRMLEPKNGRLMAGDLSIDSVTPFAPCAQHVPLSIAASETGRRIIITIRGNPDIISESEVRQFATVLVNQIANWQPTSDSVN